MATLTTVVSRIDMTAPRITTPATIQVSLRVTDNYYTPVSFGSTLYHLLGIDPDKELFTTTGQPIKISTDSAPLIKEVIAFI